MNLKSQIETILFVHGDPISARHLATITGTTVAEIKHEVEELTAEYTQRGLTILRVGDSYQLGTNPAASSLVENLVKSQMQEELSKAALETLAIIAYRGPMNRQKLEYIRGVNSSVTLRNLLMRGLVERDGTRYRTSHEFLASLGVTHVEELPNYTVLAEEVRAVEAEADSQVPEPKTVEASNDTQNS